MLVFLTSGCVPGLVDVMVFYLCSGSGSADKSGGVQCQKQTLSCGYGGGLELPDGDGGRRED